MPGAKTDLMRMTEGLNLLLEFATFRIMMKHWVCCRVILKQGSGLVLIGSILSGFILDFIVKFRFV